MYLLNIVETIKLFINVSLGQWLKIYTDYENITCKNFNTDIVLIWRLKLVEYGPDVEYIKGDKYIVWYKL